MFTITEYNLIRFRNILKREKVLIHCGYLTQTGIDSCCRTTGIHRPGLLYERAAVNRSAGLRDAMAGYIPGLLPANHSQEKEFAQAYEDVLERYKGKLLTKTPVCFLVYFGESLYAVAVADILCLLYICYLLSVVQGQWRMVGLYSHGFVTGQRTSSASLQSYIKGMMLISNFSK